jgi:ribosomal-protein-alanine N-acetyltransferase
MRLGDVPAANTLQQLAFPHDAWSETSLRDQLAAPADRWWVVAESTSLESTGLESTSLDSPIVGLAGSSVAGEVVDVLSLAVHPAARRRGIGRSLLTELLAQARTTAAERVLLEVAVDNDAALALYEAAHFTAISRRPRYYDGPDGVATVDALVLELVL